MSKKANKVTYASSGVNYDAMDPIKKLAQLRAKATAKNLSRFSAHEIAESRGESAYVWEENDCYRAFVIEGLGTKNLVADAMRTITGKTYYDTIAQDTVAMIVNDLIVVGASPQVINAYFATGSSDWFTDQKRAEDLVNGWANACDIAGGVWGGGETPTLKRVVNPETIDLAGSAVGVIKPKQRLTLGDKLQSGDRILLIESSGIHANGLTLVRSVAEKIPDGYATELPDGTLFGEALLAPTRIYAKYINELFEQSVTIHYMVNITGHGWRKLMRATYPFTYVIENIPTPHPLFDFLQNHSGNDNQEMYGNFNMGAGFAIFLPERDINTAQELATKHGFKSINAGFVEKGEKQVIVKPKNIVFKGKTLDLR